MDCFPYRWAGAHLCSQQELSFSVRARVFSNTISISNILLSFYEKYVITISFSYLRGYFSTFVG
jgi:hypothetical protein